MDLALLVPCAATENICSGALERPRALGIRPVTFRIFVEAGRDGGARTRGPSILRAQRYRFTHALLIFDYEGSGANVSATELERTLDDRLAEDWGDRAKSIVVEPEIDAWMWGNETHLCRAFGWPIDRGVRATLSERGFAFDNNDKPHRPKEALEAMCAELKVPLSASLYREVAERTSLQRCIDPAFVRLRATMSHWFPT